MSKRTRLLAVGLYASTMGMGRVLRHIATELSGRYEVHFLALHCQAKEIFEKDGVRVYPVSTPSIRSARYAWMLTRALRPDIVLLFVEPHWLAPYVQSLCRFRPQSKIVAYLPLEGRFASDAVWKLLAPLDACVLYTQYSADEVNRIRPAPIAGRPAPTKPTTAIVPHGVDCDQFHPLAESLAANQLLQWRRHAKQLAFPDEPSLHEGFLVLNPNLPFERKRLDITVRGFARFAKEKPANVRLCLHHSRHVPGACEELLQLAREEGMEDRLVLSPRPGFEGTPLSIERLNALYNASEVGINTAMGEGWGLTSFEHAATGAAQIVPGHTTFLENWMGIAEMLEPVEKMVAKYPRFEMDVVSVESVTASLERLYDDTGYRHDMARRAYEHVSDPRYQWSAVADRMHDLIQQVLTDGSVVENGVTPCNQSAGDSITQR